MAISNRLQGYLKEAGVRYSVAKHPVVYTAQEIAAAQHVPGRQLAKSVLLIAGRDPVLAVLPAIHRVDLAKLKRLLKATKLSIARESDVKSHFPDVEVGAMSPFGNLYELPVVVDESLAGVGEIVFNGGSHAETIKMNYRDFARLVRPRVGDFGESATPAPKRKGARAKKPAKTSAKKSARRPAKRKKTATRRRSPARAKSRRRSRRR